MGFKRAPGARQDAAMKKRITELGNMPLSLSTSDFANLVDDETEKWRKVIQKRICGRSKAERTP
jgi:hypothetical protein